MNVGQVSAPVSGEAIYMLNSVDVVVPVYNEEACVEEFVDRVTAVGLRDALIIVDNGSSDRTVERIARFPGIRLIRHRHNMGYGASIRDGLRESRAAHVVIIDADLEYPPEAIPDLLEALAHQSVVYGSRFAQPTLTNVPWVRRRGNGLMTRAFNLLFSQELTDLYTGMKALRREAIAALSLRSDGFDHVAEMAVELALAGYRIGEIPIPYAPRTRGTSKMRHVRETVKALGYLSVSWLRNRVLQKP